MWSVEEQAKLEYLLKVFPSEQKEIRRWEKIAKALGNRTAKQVLHKIVVDQITVSLSLCQCL